jgi:hypothetical protein
MEKTQCKPEMLLQGKRRNSIWMIVQAIQGRIAKEPTKEETNDGNGTKIDDMRIRDMKTEEGHEDVSRVSRL